jgi:hypothetical protein
LDFLWSILSILIQCDRLFCHHAVLIGVPLIVWPRIVDSEGTLREGPMVVPQVSSELGRRISDALGEIHIAWRSTGRVIEPMPTANADRHGFSG